MDKLNVAFHSSPAHIFTGYSKTLRNVLLYLYKNHRDKINIFEFANGLEKKDSTLEHRPWKAFGTLPSHEVLKDCLNHQKDELEAASFIRRSKYGDFLIDELMRENKIDVYFGIEDVWAQNGYYNRLWWKHTNNFLWHTIDSLPVIEEAYDFAKNPYLKKYFHPASFAVEEINKVVPNKSLHLFNSIRTDDFYPLSKKEKTFWRKRFGIDEEEFVGIFVFRNQLRKQVAQLLEGFARFKKKNGKGKIILITNYAETSWNIEKLRIDSGIDRNDVLTAYVCNNCGDFFVSPYIGNDIDCPICKAQKSCHTVSVQHGLTEEQLNICYNLADYCPHFCTSGGMEIPIYEAKLACLPTLTNSYACCKDAIVAGGIEVEYDITYEQQTNFIKAATKIEDIAAKIEEVYLMSDEERNRFGNQGREYTLKYTSESYVGEKIFEHIIQCSKIDWNKVPLANQPNPDCPVNLDLTDHKDFIREVFLAKFGRLPNKKEFTFFLDKLNSVS